MKKASLNAEKQSSGAREPWPKAKLGEVCEIISGVSYSKGDIASEGIRILRGGNLKEDHNLYLSDDDVFLPEQYASEKNTVRKNDIVVVNSTGSLAVIGRAAIARKDYPKTQIGAFLRIIRPLVSDYAPWIAYIFCSPFYQRHIQDMCQGASIKNLKSSCFSDFEIPLPPLSVQLAVVARLEGEMKAVGRLEAGFREMAKAAEAAFAAELAEAFAAGAGAGEDGGNGRVEHKEHKESGLVGAGVTARPRGASGGSCVSASAGEPAEGGFFNACAVETRSVSEGRSRSDDERSEATARAREKRENGRRGEGEPWPKAKLGEIAEIGYGYTAKTQPVSDSKPRYLRITDIKNDTVDWSSVPCCDCDSLAEFELHEGDIVFARTGATTGKSYLLKGDFPKSVFASYLIRVVINDQSQCLPSFLRYYFDTPKYWRVIQDGIAGAAQGGFNSKKLAALEIPLPPLAVQRSIVSRLEAAAGRRARIVALADEGAAAAADLRKAILKESFE